jgi:hypothetical protein
MALSPKCRVGGCPRNEAATVIGEELPGPLQLCFAHTEQYRQNREGWKIDWAAGASEPSSVFAPSTWAAAPLIAPAPEVPAADLRAGKGPAWMGGASRLRDWTRDRRSTRRDPRG